MSSKNLLVELFVEELPPKSLKLLSMNFAGSIESSLRKRNLLDDGSVSTEFASPRRLGVHISKVIAKAPDQSFKQKLMPASIGLDANGNPTQALLKKLSSIDANADIKNLGRESDGKQEILFYEGVQPGLSLSEALQKAIEFAIDNLPIPKVMTYQLHDNTANPGWDSVNFVRPAHGLVALHGSDLVDISVLGLKSSNSTQGHRFEAKVSPVKIKDADSYPEQLKSEGAVIASFEERRTEIVRQLTEAAKKQNLKPIEDDALLDEVTALVERPNVLLGQFEEEYLEVPQECLILTMKANQKYFPLLDANNKLTNKFLIVSNISPADPSKVIGGNERVVRPRLADAKFFYDQDRKKTLESRVAGLDKVVYHNKLGSQGERILRVRAIAKAIGQELGGDKLAAQADQAAMLAKADLLTDMVGEFPELQGIMGRYYAQHEKLDDDIAYAIEDHYKPRFAGDELPRNQVGVCVALADKLETLVGMFGIGNVPTGDKDPFALRRHALGMIRILIERSLSINLFKLLDIACKSFEPKLAANTIEVFLFERLAGFLREQGYSANEVDAVLYNNLIIQELYLLPKKLEAVRAFSSLAEAPALAAANKRVANILKKIEGEISSQISSNLLQEAAEKNLNEALLAVKPKADSLFEAGDYTASLKTLAALKEPVDSFFDEVMVNSESPDLRKNRLALLIQLQAAMNRVADLSKLAA